jgi:hypothetical protein
MGVEWVAVGAVLAAGALFFGFPAGVAVGYMWRDRISRNRRLRVALERARAELDVPPALALMDIMPIERSNGKTAEEAVVANPTTSDRPIAKAIELNQSSVSRARKPTGAVASVDKRPRRQSAKNVKLTTVTGDAHQQPTPLAEGNNSAPTP